MISGINILPEYRESYQQFDLLSLSRSENTIIGIDRDLKVNLLNDAYYQFALQNNGEDIKERFSLGSNILSAISGEQREYYKYLFRKLFDSNKHHSHDYECSSVEKYRLYKMFLYPSKDNVVLLLEHTRIEEKPINQKEISSDPKDFIDKNNVMVQCGHCRKVRNIHNKQWCWLKESFTYKRISHTICNICFDTYYYDDNI